MIINGFPEGFIMPAEFEPHEGTIIIFPERAGSWGSDPTAAQQVFSQIISEIAKDETAYVIVNERSRAAAEKMLDRSENIKLLDIDSDDSWARDVAPTFVIDRNNGIVRGIDWNFNAWGGEYDGLYASWERDNALAARFCELTDRDVYNMRHFTLEGGSIHSDGEGTVMVTESCLLSRGRNPKLTKAQIEAQLCIALGAEKILWLPRGIYNDETNEHVDNVCAFIRPAEVVLAWTDDRDDPQYKLSEACMKYLEKSTDAKGRSIVVHKLPIPDIPVCVTEADMEGYVFEDGEDNREAGERLAASYVNFYFTNGAVLLPQFGGENAASDDRAVQIMSELCPERRIVPIDADRIIRGGGNIHCITQQIPTQRGDR